MRKNITPELLDQYLAGTCTEAEARLVEAWYRSFEQQPDLQQDFPDTLSGKYRKYLFRRIRAKIQQTEKYPPGRARLWVKYPNLTWLAAASVVLVSVLVLWPGNKGSTPLATVPAAVSIVLANEQNIIRTYTLPDSSQVWLNPHSRLTYAPDYGQSVREVALVGEAFFDVTPNPQKPFIIRAGNMTTEVLGTSFNVQAFQDERPFEVSVVTGTVAVRSAKEKVILSAKQQVRFDPVSETLTEYRQPAARQAGTYQLWEPVSINFEWTSVGTVAASLEKMFGVRVEFSDKALKDCYIRADFSQMRLPMILDLLCNSIDATYTLENNLITLSGPGC
ncbi:FecR domain-containing protein [Rhabdobacter roseus]|uniref:Ferric-dicitrate binding protein FerR (Iron transport regulator) n=1 Tax=Rhabdobacter roseus TaxID=1655419 RepID=A0A840TXA3_9BACT|nr:FecR domain-containing protein [Rhabdobacter roseus]MBB5284560.1 ferric-dicitrate binding protein FerR (iron transport regulator) [Rhabdobacter roseus]